MDEPTNQRRCLAIADFNAVPLLRCRQLLHVHNWSVLRVAGLAHWTAQWPRAAHSVQSPAHLMAAQPQHHQPQCRSVAVHRGFVQPSRQGGTARGTCGRDRGHERRWIRHSSPRCQLTAGNGPARNCRPGNPWWSLTREGNRVSTFRDSKHAPRSLTTVGSPVQGAHGTPSQQQRHATS